MSGTLLESRRTPVSVSRTRGDLVFDMAMYAFGALWIVAIMYPLIYIISSLFSDPIAVMTGRVWLLPVDPTLDGYRAVFQNEQIWLGYYNTFIYTVVGTAINIVLTLMIAYPLSRVDLKGAGVIMFLVVFPMFFQGGLVPTYLLVRDLGLLNTR